MNSAFRSTSPRSMTAGKYGFVFLFLFLSPVLLAQKTKQQLQIEKQKSLEKIKEVEKILSETTGKKKNTLGELNALNQRIESQEGLIQSIKSELELLDREIREDNSIIAALEADLQKLKKEYASMIFAAQKANDSATRLTFLFSAESFDQLVMRLRYLRQYSQLRKLQADQIMKTQDQLASQVRTTEAKRNSKNQLLHDEVNESTQLTSLKTKQKTLVKNLEKQEKQLKGDLSETRKAVAKLDKMISDIIREEIARAEREAREARERAAKANAPVAPAPSAALSASFEQNKSKFPWPVEGFVSDPFGVHWHPVLKGIEVRNEGINIQTKENAKVRSIFGGTVSAITFHQGLGTTIIIKHGEYFTVYTGLKDVQVRARQEVATSQELGSVLSDANGVAELRFQIRKSFTPLNPQQWLRN